VIEIRYVWVFHDESVDSARKPKLHAPDNGDLKPWLELVKDEYSVLTSTSDREFPYKT
jgi:hypothetical protein